MSVPLARTRVSTRVARDLDPANIRAVQAVHTAAMLEALRLFDVADRIAALFRSGALPIASVTARDKLRDRAASASRLTSAERRGLYARVLGVGGAGADPQPNRDFADLWLRFVASVAELARQRGADALLAGSEAVRRTGRDLAANLSLHGYGLTHAARGLQAEITRILDLLAEPEIKSAYGARDLWRVVDRVAMDLGGAADPVRHRASADAGRTIIEWLARRARHLGRRYAVLKLSPQHLGAGGGARDGDLVNACEHWLAVSGRDGDVPPP
jgi:hypothetical protein